MLLLTITSLSLAACGDQVDQSPLIESVQEEEPVVAVTEPRTDVYVEFPLVADLSHLSDGQRQMLVLLIEASQIMDDLFWRQAYGDNYQAWLASIGVADARRFAEANYGPWDRLNDETPFMPDAGEKPLGARFYPADMTKDEFEAANLEGKTGLYSFIRRNESVLATKSIVGIDAMICDSVEPWRLSKPTMPTVARPPPISASRSTVAAAKSCTGLISVAQAISCAHPDWKEPAGTRSTGSSPLGTATRLEPNAVA
jgi:hypothetical protein